MPQGSRQSVSVTYQCLVASGRMTRFRLELFKMNRELTGWVVRSRVWVMHISVWSGTSHCAMVAANMMSTLGLCADGKACPASRL